MEDYLNYTISDFKFNELKKLNKFMKEPCPHSLKPWLVIDFKKGCTKEFTKAEFEEVITFC